jgi:PPM family protein phosphatase
MIQLAGGAESSRGQVRSQNQDRCLLTPAVAGVADGMGGHAAGETAAQIAVDGLTGLRRPLALEDLVDAVREANEKILEQADDPRYRGMGTTLVALTIIDDDVVVINVGDSRAYRLVDGGLEQLTEDHSLVEDLVRQGQLTADEARVHPQRNIVTRALGIGDDLDIDVFRTAAHPGDRYLLCSDGLFNEVEPERIAGELRRWDDPADAARQLVLLANEAGARDNVTCVVVDLDGDGDGTAAGTVADRTVRPDVAGFRAPPSRPPRPAVSADRERRRVVPWRAVPYVLGVLVITGVAVGGTLWWARTAYFVDDVDGEVVILQGRPGGVLWMDPVVVEETGIAYDELTGASQQRLANPPVGSLDQARRLVEGLQTRDPGPEDPVTTTTVPGTTGPPRPTPTSPTTAPTTTTS